ncbi:hypothetical protein BGW41_003476 [Actinomortierella wolfii]|nr:hypothetical protein BGW41_003476 [Actinomortierella wolfii]
MSTIDREPTKEDFIRWATGRAPTHPPPRMPGIPGAPRDSNQELVSQPFTQNIQATGATGVDLFRDPKNHPDAVGTILTHAATLTNFFPAKGLEDQSKQFGDYITKVSTFPGFLLTYNEQTSQMQTEVNVDLMIDQIKSAYDGVMGADVGKVIDSVKSMANSILNHSSKTADKALFTQMTISKEDDNYLYVSIFYTTLHMEYDKSGKKTYSSQKYYINRSLFRVLTATLTTNAEKLYELLGNGSFDDWAKGATSPTGSKLSCFEKNVAAAPKEV